LQRYKDQKIRVFGIDSGTLSFWLFPHIKINFFASNTGNLARLKLFFSPKKNAFSFVPIQVPCPAYNTVSGCIQPMDHIKKVNLILEQKTFY